MKYEKPVITTLDELSAMEWAVPKDGIREHPLRVVACSKSSPAGCHCTMGQSRASYRKPARSTEYSHQP